MSEPNVDEKGAEGIANAGASNSSVDGASNLPEELVKALETILDKRLKPIEGNISGIYSRQDKDRNAFDKFLDEYNKQKAKSPDLSEAELRANTKLALDASEEEGKQKKMVEELYRKFVEPDPSSASGGNGNTGGSDVGSLVSELGLDANDPRVVALRASNLGPTKLMIELTRLSLSKPPQNAAQQPAKQGATAPSDYGENDYAAERDKIMASGMTHDERLRALSELQAKARSAGLNK